MARANSRLRVTSPVPRQVWQELLAKDPTATTSQTPGWLDCICRVGGYEDASRLYETAEGRRLVLPMVRCRLLPQAFTVEASLPASWGTGGLVAAGSVRPEDIATVWPDIVAPPSVRVRLRPYFLTAAAWNAVQPPAGVVVTAQTVHVLDLEGGFDRVWRDRFKSQTRGGIRKAERANLQVEFDASGRLLTVFYDLYLDWIGRRAQERGLLPWLSRWRASMREPKRKFEAVAETLGDRCRTWIAWSHGQPIAAVITLLHGAHAFYWRGYSNKDLAAPVRANDLLQRLAIEDACRAGCRYYSMGESGGVASLMEFKSRFGARPQRFPQYTFTRAPLGEGRGLAWRSRAGSPHAVLVPSSQRTRPVSRRPRADSVAPIRQPSVFGSGNGAQSMAASNACQADTPLGAS
jgi:Acetyltransferase (GNAT) domain